MTAVSGQSYLSKDGDVLDEVVFAHYGDTSGGKVEAVLAANPGLAALGATFNAGVTVFLPDLEQDTQIETDQLWG
ncbi:tail protein X [Ruegeria marisrubri]|uniref:tail protein X n=1 Tax=Ruegeria marisrubri TaxID=1685379 RepID=UPI001CD738D6|nr:tail protein X [Ruegeria marisrubri]MCA0905120.1 tail protein X [Ruegeria marisrubri]